MSTLIPDFVGFSGNRLYDSVEAASVDKTAIEDLIVNTLTAVGWTKLSGPTPVTHGNEYELYSAQDPWYNTTNIPSWYVGGRIYMKIIHPNASAISFQFGEYYNGSATNVMTGISFFLDVNDYPGTPTDLRILGNPYECWIFTDEVGTTDKGFYCGVLNVPKPIQQGQRVISSILATKFSNNQQLLGDSGIQYVCWRTMDVVESYFGNPSYPASFLTVKGGTAGNFGYQSARRIWRPSYDPAMAFPKRWHPFYAPPAVAFGTASKTAEPEFAGFLRDSFIICDGCEKNTVFEELNKRWVVYATTVGETTSSGASLILNYGPAGTDL